MCNNQLNNPKTATDSGTSRPQDPAEDPDFDAKAWIMQNICFNEPIERLRNDLQGFARTAGFENVDVRNLGAIDLWDLRFTQGTNIEC